MSTGSFVVPTPVNEPVKGYVPGSAERDALQTELDRMRGEIIEIPVVVAGERHFTGNTVDITNPSAKDEVIARVHLSTPELTRAAIEAAEAARAEWAALPWEHRVGVFLKAADMLAGPWRARANATTMVGQGKTCHQAEIDVVCELADFWRFNAKYVEQIQEEQPPVSPRGIWNRLDQRPLDGFVFAITPFNFTSIALNLPTAPAMVGNTAVWKPSLTSSLSCWALFEMLEEAGLPPGVINFVNGHGADVGDIVLADPRLGGVHFTGSTPTFQHIWKEVGMNIARYNQYPRLVGETGGKDFIVAHPSANAEQVATAILRGAFEFQGQKCSAASRMYMPKSLWPAISEIVVRELGNFTMGDVRDFHNFLGPVIDERAFNKIGRYQDLAKETANVLSGGGRSSEKGWFIEPTLVQVDDPKHTLMVEEIFGPVATVYVYDDEKWDETLELVDSTSPYALTGAVFAGDRRVLHQASEALRNAAGNFYLNDKPTGAVVGQQPFGGGRASGTNDKAGSILNLLRWLSPRTIKENMVPPTEWRYPFLG